MRDNERVCFFWNPDHHPPLSTGKEQKGGGREEEKKDDETAEEPESSTINIGGWGRSGLLGGIVISCSTCHTEVTLVPTRIGTFATPVLADNAIRAVFGCKNGRCPNGQPVTGPGEKARCPRCGQYLPPWETRNNKIVAMHRCPPEFRPPSL